MTFARSLMTASALLLALLGLPCMFAPEIVLAQLSGGSSPVARLVVEIAGALYLGFAILNWMARGSVAGGIYGRPVTLGNFLHFLAAGLALIKAAPTLPFPQFIWPLAIVYALFAIGFARAMFRGPV
jgi:hypothetical protein